MAAEEKQSNIFANLYFLNIFKTFRMAIQPSKLIIAFSAVAIICLAGWLMDFSKSVVTTPDTNNRITELQIYLASPERLQPYIKGYEQSDGRTGVFSVLWHFASNRFHGALNSLLEFDIPAAAQNIFDYFRAVGWAIRYHYIYCAIFMTIKLAVLAIAGGSIARIAALQFAGGQKPGLIAATRFGISKFRNLFTAPLLPIAIIIGTGLLISILGLIVNIPLIGELILALAIPLILVAGIVIALVLVGTVAGFNLMWPAVAYDGSDCFDVISRTFSYIYNKPWSMTLYTLTAAVYGGICYLFVRLFAFLVLAGAHAFLRLGIFVNSAEHLDKLAAIWPQPEFMDLLCSTHAAPAIWSQSLSAFIVNIFVSAVVAILVGFVISFYFSANTIIYALMRKKVDDTPTEAIYVQPHSEEDVLAADQSQ